ncbi:MAG: DUF2213 domain-containing protein, partial [Ruminococcus flavefaciens]|nr:DUF2213 domain-containing protein [Ruminococcus flavefaciens]
MLDYYGTQISPNQIETGEGFLVCRNVPIARTGEMVYLAQELQLDGDPERPVTVYRDPADVFEAEAMASFEGKPVTDGHPPENVGPENFSAYARGHVQNVRRDGEFLVADLYINDASLACDVRGGTKREVSCGYLCVYTPDGGRYRQSSIRGNHVAVVPRGRAGHEVAIKDAAKEAEKGRSYMSKFTEAVLSALGMAAKEAKTDEEMAALVSTTAVVLDADPTAAKEEPGKPAAEQDAGPAPAGDKCAPAGDEVVEKAPKGDDLGSKLDKVIEMLASLQHKNDREEKDLHDEKILDALIGALSGGPSDQSADAGGDMSQASKDAAVKLFRQMRPAVAAIKDEQERSRVVDALISAVKGPDMVAQVMGAAAGN